MSTLIDFVLHIDAHLVNIVNQFGGWTYGILFVIIFIETGAIILPFLPGDSLLFAASALAANSVYHLNIWLFVFLFLAACLLGDSVNFHVAKRLGRAAVHSKFFGRFINEEKLHEAEGLFDRMGGFTITIARFMPIIRTFIPFVAGSSTMAYRRFLPYNFLGGAAWVALCCAAGFWFGNYPIVKEHFSLVVIGIIVVSLIPMVISAIKGARRKATN
ncbi:VTT domain-containing protein [Lacticaseibacillus thailandensis]|uniref:DedA family membrane protein n=1 Tax=Lacticaseibacillus thailandensis DSM 22698 = JCM 13996 TaxID=1423810 RepID=A0A0R2CCP0_9LACO|nr:VTT domain-containing protein [Lacticaseibacillus thailandensis]KRM87764.1 DedA family membrane protein [Lacticaseibacillus thailandensis DSM 22698 = JCM 13996]